MECVRVHSLSNPGSNKRNVLRRAGTYLTPLTWFLQPKATTSLRPQPFLPRQAEAVYPLLGHHVLGNVEDLLNGLLATPGPPVKRSRRLAHCCGSIALHMGDLSRFLA